MTATASPLANLTNSPSIASPTSAQKPFDQLEEPTTPVPPPPPPPAAPAAAATAAPTPASTVRAALGAFAALKHPLSASGVGVLNVIAAYLYCFEPNVVAASLWLGLVAVITGFYWTWVVGPPSAPPAALTAAELQPALERAVELYNRGAAASLAVVRATEPKAALAVAASLWAGAHAAAALGATFFVWAALDLVLCGPPLARALAARARAAHNAGATVLLIDPRRPTRGDFDRAWGAVDGRPGWRPLDDVGAELAACAAGATPRALFVDTEVGAPVDFCI